MSRCSSAPLALVACLAAGLLPAAQQGQVRTTLDTVLEPTVAWCEPGLQCVWDVAVRFDLPVGIQVDDLVDQAVPRKRSPLQVPPSTVRQFLDGFVAQNPSYRWRDVGGFAVLRSERAWGDGEDALNRPVAAFDLDDVTLGAAFNKLLDVGGFRGGDLGAFSNDEQFGGEHFSARVSGGPLWETITEVARAYGHFAWKVERKRVTLPASKNGQEWVPARDEALPTLWVYRRPRR